MKMWKKNKYDDVFSTRLLLLLCSFIAYIYAQRVRVLMGKTLGNIKCVCSICGYWLQIYSYMEECSNSANTTLL